MALWTYWPGDGLPDLALVSGFGAAASTSPAELTGLTGLGADEIAARLRAGHRCYVARLGGVPVAYGRVARVGASIGELDLAFRLAGSDRYLWDLVTLPAWRGRGVYPHLLQDILRAEGLAEHRSWIINAPENVASARGIAKAGFVDVRNLAFTRHGRVGYVLLRPVNRTLALVATVSRLVMTAIHGVNLLNHVAVLTLLSGAGYLTVFAPNQLQALAMLFLDTYNYGFTIGLVFFVLHTFLLGYLIYKSGYFPRLLGVLFMFASVGYLGDSFLHVLVANHVTGAAYFALPIAIAEIAFPLWLLFKGVHAERWAKRASAEPVGLLVAASAGAAR